MDFSGKKNLVKSVAIVEWVQSAGCKFNLEGSGNNLFTYAVFNDSVHLLRWAPQKYPPNEYPAGVSDTVCNLAALYNRLGVLEYLGSLRSIIRWNENVCHHAAIAGNLSVFKWL